MSDAHVKLARKVAEEYRESMDKDVLHSWAKDAVLAIKSLLGPEESSLSKFQRERLEYFHLLNIPFDMACSEVGVTPHTHKWSDAQKAWDAFV